MKRLNVKSLVRIVTRVIQAAHGRLAVQVLGTTDPEKGREKRRRNVIIIVRVEDVKKEKALISNILKSMNP